jgi:hypothetical protein
MSRPLNSGIACQRQCRRHQFRNWLPQSIVFDPQIRIWRPADIAKAMLFRNWDRKKLFEGLKSRCEGSLTFLCRHQLAAIDCLW